METRNKAIIQRLYKEVLFDWKLDQVEELIAPEFVPRDLPEGSPTGPQPFKDFYTQVILSVFPDARYEVEDLIAEGDRVVVRWRMQGTHQGQYEDVPPTGKSITLKGIAIYRLKDGKVSDRWVYTNVYHLLKAIQAG